jgi:hypothetical protein
MKEVLIIILILSPFLWSAKAWMDRQHQQDPFEIKNTFLNKGSDGVIMIWMAVIGAVLGLYI